MAQLAEPKQRVIALTFDDGPSEWTTPILDKLAAFEVVATFFLVGDATGGREDVVRRIALEGHEVGNHSLSHPHLDTLEGEAIHQELLQTSERLSAILGRPPSVFRPPYFAYNQAVLEAAAACGFPITVGASLYTEDWSLSSGAEIASPIIEGAKPGAVIALHDGRPPHDPPHADGASRDDRWPTVESIDLIVPALLEDGYRFVTVSQLLRNPRRF